jgi:hypothetical protein
VTSIADIRAGNRLALEFLRSDDETQHQTLLALAEFEESLDSKRPFESWCAIGGESTSEDAGDRYDVLSALYLALWKVLGHYEFAHRIADAKQEGIELRRTYNR